MGKKMALTQPTVHMASVYARIATHPTAPAQQFAAHVFEVRRLGHCGDAQASAFGLPEPGETPAYNVLCIYPGTYYDYYCGRCGPGNVLDGPGVLCKMSVN